MAKSRALVNKLKRRKNFLNRNKGYERQDKVNKADEILNDSPAAFALMRKVERRKDRNFGIQTVPSPDKMLLERLMLINDLDRFDFDPGAGTDYGIRIRVDVEEAAVAESTLIDCIADTGAFEKFTATYTTGALSGQADYIIFTAPSGDTYAVWLDIDAAGTAPTGAAYLAADNQIMASVLSTDTAAQLATKVYTAIGTIPDMTKVDHLDGTISLTSDLLGPIADAAPHNAGDTGNGSIGITIDTQGAASNLQGTSFKISSPTITYGVWFNVNGEGSEPVIPNVVDYIEVALVGGEADTAVAALLAGELDGAVFDASAMSDVVTANNVDDGSAPDAEDVDTGFDISTDEQGSDAVNRKSFQALGMAVGDIVKFEEGALKGISLAVEEVIDDNTLRLEDHSLSAPETDLYAKMKLSGSKKSYF